MDICHAACVAGSSNQLPSLTTIEAKVITTLISGRNQEETARVILVSKRRVEEVISDMKEKYNCTTLVQLIHFLSQNGLI
jgi:DNA-binding CsgD family transcriptional regulator